MTRHERYKRRLRNRGHPVRRMLVIGVLLVVTGLAIGALAAVGWVVAVANTAPNLRDLRPRHGHALTKIYAADGTLLGYVHADTVFTYVSAEADSEHPPAGDGRDRGSSLLAPRRA